MMATILFYDNEDACLCKLKFEQDYLFSLYPLMSYCLCESLQNKARWKLYSSAKYKGSLSSLCHLSVWWTFWIPRIPCVTTVSPLHTCTDNTPSANEL